MTHVPGDAVVALAGLAATSAMFGIIWLVQLVHYPLMALVDADRFVEYEGRHSSVITLIVFPLMTIELCVAGLQAFDPPSGAGPLGWIGFALALGTWVATGVWSAPAHRGLGNGFDAVAHATLVRTNWVRTGLWTAHVPVAAWLVVATLR